MNRMPLVSVPTLTKSGNNVDLYLAYDLSGALQGKPAGITGSVQYKGASGNFAGNSGLVYDGVSKLTNQDSENFINLNSSDLIKLSAIGGIEVTYPDSTPGIVRAGYLAVSNQINLNSVATIIADAETGSDGQVLTSKGAGTGVKWDNTVKSIQFSTNDPAIGELTFTGFVEQTGNTFNFTGGSGGGGQVNSVVAGTNIAVDSVDPVNPVVSVVPGGTSGQIQYADSGGNLGGANILYDNLTALYTQAGSGYNSVEFKTGSANVITLKSVGGVVNIIDNNTNPGGVSLKSITEPTSGNSINLNTYGDIVITADGEDSAVVIKSVKTYIKKKNSDPGSLDVGDLSMSGQLTLNDNRGIAGQVLISQGAFTPVVWADIPAPTPAGTTGQLQYNNAGVLGATTIVSNGGSKLTEPTTGNFIDLKNNRDDAMIVDAQSGLQIYGGTSNISISTDLDMNFRAPTIYLGSTGTPTSLYFVAGGGTNTTLQDNTGSSGTANQVLTAGSGGSAVVWANPPAPGGVENSIQVKSSHGEFVGSSLKVVNSSLVAGSETSGTDITLNMDASVGDYTHSVLWSRAVGGFAVFFNTANVGVFADLLLPGTLSFQAQAGAVGTLFENSGILQDTTGSFGVPGQVLTAVANPPYNSAPTWSWGTVPSGTATIGSLVGVTEYWIEMPNGIFSSVDAPISVTLQKPDGTTQNWIVYAELIYGSATGKYYIHVSFSFPTTSGLTTISWAVNRPTANNTTITDTDPTT